MKHVVTLTTDELELIVDVLDMADHLSCVDEDRAEEADDLHYRLDEQLQMELEENEPW